MLLGSFTYQIETIIKNQQRLQTLSLQKYLRMWKASSLLKYLNMTFSGQCLARKTVLLWLKMT